MSVIKAVLKLIVAVSTVAIIIVLAPGLPPNIEFKPFHVDPPKPRVGWFATNTVLDNAELYYESSLPGVESPVVINGDEVITGDQSGMIYKITGKQVAKNITHLKFPCRFLLYGHEDGDNAKTCSRPLGMRLDKDRNLLATDFHGGVVKVNLKSGSYESLIPAGISIEGKASHVAEDVDITSDGTIYWTDGCTNEDFFTELFGQPSGRLIKFDPKTKTNQVLLDDLYFANGISLSDDGEFVLVAEMGRATIRRYYLQGEKKGTSDMFITGLPGYPDNIRPNGKGGFYVAIFNPWNTEHSMGNHLYTPYPLFRKLVLRLRSLSISAISHAKNVFPDNTYLSSLEKYILELRPFINHYSTAPKVATIMELSKSGEVLAIFNGKSGKMHSLSQLSIGEKYGYLVNPFDNKVWRIKKDLLKVPHNLNTINK